MFRHALIFVCSVLLMKNVFGYSVDYRCGANGCLNGAECQSNGQCKCGAGQYGTYCDVSQACIVTCTDSNTITNTADPTHECSNNDANKCICKDGFTGNTCDEEILEVDCSSAPTSFTMTIRPHRYSDLTPFSGEVYVAADKAAFDDLAALDTSCKIAPGTAFDTSTADSTTCGTAVGIAGADVTYHAYIKYNAKIKSVEDQIIEVTCTTGASKSAIITNTIVDSSKEVQKTTINTVDDVTMKIRKDGGSTLSDFQVHDTVKVNDNIALTLESTSDFLIRWCKVSDGESTPDEIPLINDWCVNNEGLILYSSKIIAVEKSTTTSKYAPYGLTVNTNAVKLPLKAVKFTTGSKMIFTCELCTKRGCKITPTPGYGGCDINLHIGSELLTYQQAMDSAIQANRRRRSVTNGEVGTSISVSLTVEEYKTLLREANESKKTECFKSAVVLLPLILLASLLVISMGMTFFFCNKFTQNMTEGQRNIGFKA